MLTSSQVCSLPFLTCYATVPTCLKTAVTIPVPKHSNISCLNDYRPAGLTPIIAKGFKTD